jgi:hypothetical protein
MIKSIKRSDYLLLLSSDPCELFKFFNIEQMHGLKLSECLAYNNSKNDSYIAGLCNYIPKDEYKLNDPCFVYINLTRCKDEKTTLLTLFHELMHMSLQKFQWNLHREEEIITWAENETNEVLDIIKQNINL